MQKREQQRDSDRFHARLLQLLHDTPQVAFIERFDYLARRHNTFSNAEPEIIVDEWRGFDRVEVIQLRTRLAADHEHVFKTSCCYQSDARAAALQQGIRADSRAMHHFDFRQLHPGFSADAR
jgi:hypothetical protein